MGAEYPTLHVALANAPSDLSYTGPLIGMAFVAAILAFFLARRPASTTRASIAALLLVPAVAIWLMLNLPADLRLGLLGTTLWLVAFGLGWSAGRGARSWHHELLIFILLLSLIASIGAIRILPDAARFAERRHQEKVTQYFAARDVAWQQESEARARKCIVEIARRSPEADADADIRRGDLTPLGQTESDHWDPDPRTSYVNACPNDLTYEGALKPTGKWLKPPPLYGGTQFSPLPVASKRACERAVHTYIGKYNRHMVAREPDSVRRFCERQKISNFSKAAMGCKWNSETEEYSC